MGGSFGALERSSDFAIVLSSPPKGDSRLTRLKFSMEDFFLAADLLSASWIKLEILEGTRCVLSTVKEKVLVKGLIGDREPPKKRTPFNQPKLRNYSRETLPDLSFSFLLFLS